MHVIQQLEQYTDDCQASGYRVFYLIIIKPTFIQFKATPFLLTLSYSKNIDKKIINEGNHFLKMRINLFEGFIMNTKKKICP